MILRVLYNSEKKIFFLIFFNTFPHHLPIFFKIFISFYKQDKAYFITNSTVYNKVMLRRSHFPKIIKNHSIMHGTRTHPCTMEVSLFDFDEPLICCSTDKNKGPIFFYTCPYALLGGETPLWRKSDFFFRSVYRWNYKR
jgi:hypothetical protein